MSKGICAVTGTTGFLGHHIANKMKASGWSVTGMQRNTDRNEHNYDKIVSFTMGEEPGSETLSGVDVLIHCAYDFSCNNWDKINDINVKGTRLLFESAQKAGVGLIVFISSMHAFEGCRTMYGKAKLDGEKLALDQGGIVIRPGTSYIEEGGKLYGGLGGNTLQSFERLFQITPVIPILYSKNPIIYTTNIQDLSNLVEEAILKKDVLDKPICAVNPVPMTLKQFLIKIKNYSFKKKILFIPVPWQIPWLFLLILEKLRINLSFKSDSILNFFDQNPEPDFSAFEHLETKMRTFQ